MQHRVLHSISRFFAGTGHVIGTPSGDARGHVRVPNGTMYDADAAARFMGR
jgi:hypothetical protein